MREVERERECGSGWLVLSEWGENFVVCPNLTHGKVFYFFSFFAECRKENTR